MKTIGSIPYLENSTDKQVLDIHLPDNKTNFDTIIWMHGGGLVNGSRYTGAYAKILTEAGYCMVSVEYRMYPDAKFPEFIEDSAAAVAYVIKNIKNYGGSGKVYVSGESAGAYITMMLCMDHSYLDKVGVNQEQIAGYLSDSAQQFNHFNVLREMGFDPRLERIDEHAPIFFVNGELKIRPLLMIYYENDMKCRPEETRLMYASIKKVMPEAYVKIQELPGTHCNRPKNKNGGILTIDRFIEFIKELNN